MSPWLSDCQSEAFGLTVRGHGKNSAQAIEMRTKNTLPSFRKNTPSSKKTYFFEGLFENRKDFVVSLHSEMGNMENTMSNQPANKCPYREYAHHQAVFK